MEDEFATLVARFVRIQKTDMRICDDPIRRQRSSRLDDYRELGTRRHEVVLVVPLVLPHVPALLHPEPESLHERAHDHPGLLHRQTAPNAVQRTRGERHERCFIVHELKVCGRRGDRGRGEG